eukprot:12901037-Prorocentrum_lima.AAC.1
MPWPLQLWLILRVPWLLQLRRMRAGRVFKLASSRAWCSNKKLASCQMKRDPRHLREPCSIPGDGGLRFGAPDKRGFALDGRKGADLMLA